MTEEKCDWCSEISEKLNKILVSDNPFIYEFVCDQCKLMAEELLNDEK